MNIKFKRAGLIAIGCICFGCMNNIDGDGSDDDTQSSEYSSDDAGGMDVDDPLDAVDSDTDASMPTDNVAFDDDFEDAGIPSQMDGNIPSPDDWVRFVRIRTTQSQSWVAWSEVEIIGRYASTPDNIQNLALNGEASASQSDADSSPDFAIDGDLSTSWNAGDFPAQWLLVDLGSPCIVERIRLQVQQFPAGPTVHEVEIGSNTDEMRLVERFSENSSTGMWLEYEHELDSPPPAPPAPSSDLPRGLAWVRNNPMFISGLAVSVPTPQDAHIHEYFDNFHANAVHLWANGLPNQLDDWESAGRSDFRWLSWVQNDGTTIDGGELIGGTPANSPGRIGYQIGDEPGLHGDGMVELRQVEEGLNAVRSVDPSALLLVNFSWWAEELDEMIEYYGGHMDGDIISYDLYSLRQSTYKRLEYFRKAGLRWNMPYWRYIFSYQDLGATNWPSESDLRWDAFLGLVYGYTGHTWFVYQANAPHIVESAFYQGQGGLDVEKSLRWQIAAGLNQTMRHLGRAITQLTSTEVCYIAGQPLLGLLQPEGTRDWYPGAGGDPYITGFTASRSGVLDVQDLLVGFFVDDEDEQYVMIQNPNHAGGEYQVANDDEATFEIEFDFTAAADAVSRERVLVLSGTTGQVMTHALISTGLHQARAEITLPPGDVWLFKYDTGVPFALGN